MLTWLTSRLRARPGHHDDHPRSSFTDGDELARALGRIVIAACYGNTLMRDDTKAHHLLYMRHHHITPLAYAAKLCGISLQEMEERTRAAIQDQMLQTAITPAGGLETDDLAVGMRSITTLSAGVPDATRRSPPGQGRPPVRSRRTG